MKIKLTFCKGYLYLYVQFKQNDDPMHAITNSISREITSFYDNYFKEDKLATSYVELLLMIEDYEKISQKVIATKMNLAPSTITRFINKLIKKGWVLKKMDGRISYVTLSERGEKEVPNLRNKYEQAEEDLKEILGTKFVDTTKQLLLHGAALLKGQ